VFRHLGIYRPGGFCEIVLFLTFMPGEVGTKRDDPNPPCGSGGIRYFE
jgi:hypothetical protein